MERMNVWNTYDLKTKKACYAFAEEYRQFLSSNKTERECVDTFVNEAEAAGFIELSRAIEEKRPLKPGDGVYQVWMNKSIVLFRIGKEAMENGLNILGAHIDSPRMDVKQNPVYESDGYAYFDTHYYGGIKKYQFVALPLSLHGVVVKKSGETVILNVGEDEDDPVFFVSDLLIHLAQDQMQKTAATVIAGAALDLIVGNQPIIIDSETKPEKLAGADWSQVKEEASKSEPSEKEASKEGAAGAAKEAVKAALLEILKRDYGIEEDDFASAELEIVPAGKARDAGFDRSMILGYGQDDRVCAYPSFRAIIETKKPARTSVCLLVDKEEIGSVGATGMQSHFFENALAEVLNLAGQYSDLALRRTLANSCMLSSDVSSAYDPHWAECFETRNTAHLGKGMVFNKFTGSRGKSGSNDANAEYIAHLRGIFDKAGVTTQTAELGKVDVGGGGTIAYILALYGMNVIDSGVPVLNMHAPFEATSKADIYEAYRGYKAFLKDASMRQG
ncbi:MAG: aminopeptidase [Lachnospiraceae bacterium]|nr:aminopeptidase [Lachnospiraceae bacterium]